MEEIRAHAGIDIGGTLIGMHPVSYTHLEKVARILVETARARAEQTGRPDDITAAVLRLEPCGH